MKKENGNLWMNGQKREKPRKIKHIINYYPVLCVKTLSRQLAHSWRRKLWSFYWHLKWIFWYCFFPHDIEFSGISLLICLLIQGIHFEIASLGEKRSLWLWSWANLVQDNRGGERSNSTFRSCVYHGVQPPRYSEYLRSHRR